MAETAMEERQEYWASRGMGEWEKEELRGVKVGEKVDAAKAEANGHA
jgi:hypothetical protein